MPRIREHVSNHSVVGHHYAIIRSLRVFAKILKKFPKISFEAFTLIVEYYLFENSFLRSFKLVIKDTYVVDGYDFWLGKNQTRIIYHKLICPANDKKLFAIKLKKWARKLAKPKQRDNSGMSYRRRLARRTKMLDDGASTSNNVDN